MLNGSLKSTRTILSRMVFAREPNPTLDHSTGPPPLGGLLNSPLWVEPILKARAKMPLAASNIGLFPPHCNGEWALGSSRPMKYAAALACLRRTTRMCGFDEKFTLRSPRAVLPTWAAQLGWRKEDRAALGRWAPNSEMPNWYDRDVCNAELRLRNEILTKYHNGRTPPAAFELPKTKPTQESNDDLSPIDSTSAVTSSGEEVNIGDLDNTNGSLSGYFASV